VGAGVSVGSGALVGSGAGVAVGSGALVGAGVAADRERGADRVASVSGRRPLGLTFGEGGQRRWVGTVGAAKTAAAGNSGSSIATMSASPSARIDRPSTTFLSLWNLSGSQSGDARRMAPSS
jgi:hypothetical protein